MPEPARTILQVIRPANLTGAPRAMLLLVADLVREHGMEVTVVSGAGEALPAALRAAGAESIVCPSLVRRPSPVEDLAAFAFLLRLVRRRRFDLVHTHSSKSGILGRWAGRLGGARTVHTFHGLPWVGQRFYQAIERWTVPMTDAAIALCEADRKRLLDLGIGRPESLRVVASGLDVERLAGVDAVDLRADLGLPADTLLVGTAARFRPPKRLDLFIEMAALLGNARPGVHFVVAGEGPDVAPCEALARRLDIGSRVHFLGWRDDGERVIKALDLLVFASEWEGLPLTLLEAALLGVPAVATDVRGNNEVIADGETGWLAALSGEALAAVATRALAEPAARARIAEAARRHAAERYDRRTTAAEVAALYDELLARS